MTNFTIWRSLIDGQEPGAIPDSLVLLDDFADGNLTSDRDSLNETRWQPDNSTLIEQGEGGDISRPDWTIDNGSPSVADNILEVDRGERLRTSLELDTLDNTTWEFFVPDWGDNFSGVSIAANTTTWRDGDNNLQDGYYVRQDNSDGEGFSLLVDNGGSTDVLISTGSGVSAPVLIRVERDSDGNWELFYDGESAGTETNNDHNSSEWCGAFARDSGDESINLDWLVVDQND